jgi:hypothetical protein
MKPAMRDPRLTISLPAPTRIGSSVWLGRVEFTNTETIRPATSAAVGKAGESPEGLGWDGNKPLMRNRTAMCAIPDR